MFFSYSYWESFILLVVAARETRSIPLLWLVLIQITLYLSSNQVVNRRLYNIDNASDIYTVIILMSCLLK